MHITLWGNELSAWAMSAMLAEYGNRVVLARDKLPENGFSEPKLQQLFAKNIDSGRLTLSESTDRFASSVHFLCFAADQKTEALTLAKQLGENSASALIVINQSNFGIGATEQILLALGTAYQHSAAYIADNIPEGKSIDHLANLTSLTLGCDHIDSIETIRAIYRPFLIDPQKVMHMPTREAEFTKFAITGMLALRIGYINELANLADQLQVDIEPIRHAMTLDSRISPEYLKPGCGFGGTNFSQYIADLAKILQEERRSTLLNSVLVQNEVQKETAFRKLWRYYNGQLSGRTFSIWGLSFKPNTSSIDNAPSLRVIAALLAQDALLQVHDPAAMENIAKHYPNNPSIRFYEDPYQAVENSDALLLLTEWRAYSMPDFPSMHKLMNHAVIIDGRNHFDKQLAIRSGFHYEAIGR